MDTREPLEPNVVMYLSAMFSVLKRYEDTVVTTFVVMMLFHSLDGATSDHNGA